MTTYQEYTNKVKRLEWLREIADENNVSIYEDEINELEIEIEHFEALEAIKPIPYKPLLEFQMARLGLTQVQLANLIGVSNCYLSTMISGVRDVSENIKKKIDAVDWDSLQPIAERNKVLKEFCYAIARLSDCPPEFQEIVNREFWNLI